MTSGAHDDGELGDDSKSETTSQVVEPDHANPQVVEPDPANPQVVEPGERQRARVETHDTHGSVWREVPPIAAKQAHTSAELLEQATGTAGDSPLCMTCGGTSGCS